MRKSKALALFPDGRLPRDQATRKKVFWQTCRDQPGVDDELHLLTYEMQETDENVPELFMSYWHRTDPERDADSRKVRPLE